MKKDLSLYETRVIGVLLEKEVTTPDHYPLSLNALTNACNQKSNRHPVLELDEACVKQTLEGLRKRGLVTLSAGSRVEKYQHRFCNTEFSELKLDPQELAVVCELLLRGPQTPGELRSRANRITPIEEVQVVESVLARLATRGLVTMLPREPGKRESRYVHLFSSDIEPLPTLATDASSVSADKARISELEGRIGELERTVESLRQRLRALGEVA